MYSSVNINSQVISIIQYFCKKNYNIAFIKKKEGRKETWKNSMIQNYVIIFLVAHFALQSFNTAKTYFQFDKLKEYKSLN